MTAATLKRWANKLPFFPKGKNCPVCGNAFNHFYPLPALYPESWVRYGFPYSGADFETLNEQAFSCPSCGSTDRDRMYALYLDGFFRNAGRTVAVLDIAPGKALSGWIKKKAGVHYTSSDLFMQDVDVKADIQDMHMFLDNQFDLIICSHVLEHVPDDRKALRELYRVLKPGGQAILMVPVVKKLGQVIEEPSLTDIAERWRRFGQDDHIRLYSPEGFTNRVIEAGFELQRIPCHQLDSAAASHGIDPQGVLCIGHKKTSYS